MIRFTVGCPVCGMFVQGLTLAGAWEVVRRHNLAMLMMDDLYDDAVAQTLAEAEAVVL